MGLSIRDIGTILTHPEQGLFDAAGVKRPPSTLQWLSNPLGAATTAAQAVYDKKPKPSSDVGSGGGGEEGGSDLSGGMADYGSNYMDIMTALANAQYEAQLKYLPLQTQLNYDLQKKFLPQQYQLDLDLANQYQGKFQSLAEQMRGQDLTAQFGDVSRLSGQIPGILESAESPGTTAMRNTLRQQIAEELGMGEQLTSSQARAAEQNVRSAQAARGMSGGQSSANLEAVKKSLSGRALGTERQQKAGSFLGQEQARSVNPFSTIMGAPLTTMKAGQTGMSMPGVQTQQAGQPIDTSRSGLDYMTTMQNLAQTDFQNRMNQQMLALTQQGLNQMTAAANS